MGVEVAIPPISRTPSLSERRRLRKGYFIINGYSITIIMFFFYPYNQRYRVPQRKKNKMIYRCGPSGETIKEIQFLIDRFGGNRGKDAM